MVPRMSEMITRLRAPLRSIVRKLATGLGAIITETALLLLTLALPNSVAPIERCTGKSLPKKSRSGVNREKPLPIAGEVGNRLNSVSANCGSTLRIRPGSLTGVFGPTQLALSGLYQRLWENVNVSGAVLPPILIAG